VKYVQAHEDKVVISGSSIRTGRDLGTSWKLSGLEPIESTKIGPSGKNVQLNPFVKPVYRNAREEIGLLVDCFAISP
jgi:hypothetical protein